MKWFFFFFRPTSLLKVRSETMDDDHTSSRHCCLSRALLTHSTADNPVHSLMSSIQRLLGLPRPLIPPTRPWSIDVARFCALTMCPKYFSFCLRTSVMKSRLGSTCARTEILVCAPSSWCGGFFCTRSSQMLLTFSCLRPSVSTIHNHTLPMARPGLPRVVSLSPGWATYFSRSIREILLLMPNRVLVSVLHSPDSHTMARNLGLYLFQVWNDYRWWILRITFVKTSLALTAIGLLLLHSERNHFCTVIWLINSSRRDSARSPYQLEYYHLPAPPLLGLWHYSTFAWRQPRKVQFNWTLYSHLDRPSLRFVSGIARLYPRQNESPIPHRHMYSKRLWSSQSVLHSQWLVKDNSSYFMPAHY